MKLEKLLKKMDRQIEVNDKNLHTKYSINIDKLAQVIQLPSSEEMIDIYFQDLNQISRS